MAGTNRGAVIELTGSVEAARIALFIRPDNPCMKHLPVLTKFGLVSV